MSGDVNQLALRQQSEARERIGILAARERAEWPDRRVIDADRPAVAARPCQLLGPCRHQLAVPPEQAAVGPADQVCVVERAAAAPARHGRTSAVSGKRWPVPVDCGGPRTLKTKDSHSNLNTTVSQNSKNTEP